MFSVHHAHAVDIFNGPSAATMQQALPKTRKHVGTFKGLFDFARSLLILFVWESFHQLWSFINDPDNCAPPDEAAWVIS